MFCKKEKNIARIAKLWLDGWWQLLFEEYNVLVRLNISVIFWFCHWRRRRLIVQPWQITLPSICIILQIMSCFIISVSHVQIKSSQIFMFQFVYFTCCSHSSAFSRVRCPKKLHHYIFFLLLLSKLLWADTLLCIAKSVSITRMSQS